ncbi:MAG: hypothetical protein LUE27_00135 [Clostridia bacterium]|nr:hypothetical protein [Clostridia bacterium]
MNDLETKYNVLWIDDQWKDQSDFINACLVHQIGITPFDTISKGVAELRTNLAKWDAVILDAHVNKEENDAAVKNNLNYALREISPLQEKHRFPCFIYTGQLNREEVDKNYDESFNVYFKGDIRELKRILHDIPAKIKEINSPEFVLRNKYSKVFKATKLIPNAEELLLDGLRFELSDHESEEEIQDDFNALRKICEKIIYKCQRDEYIPYLNSLNSVPDFLSFKEIDGFKLSVQLMHPTLVQSLRYVLSITQDGSHDREDLSLQVMDYVRSRQNNNLYKSVLFVVMDLLLWYRELIEKHPDPANIWIGEYEAEGCVSVEKYGDKTLYIVDGKYSLESNGKLVEGDEVVILSSIPNSHPFERVDRFVKKGNYVIKK